MKLLLLVALCAGACVANMDFSSEWSVFPENQAKDSAFQAGREYHFFYDGQLSTGVAGASKQHSAQRIRAYVTLAFKSDSKVLLKLSNVHMGKLNREVHDPRNIMPMPAFEQVPIEPHLLAQLESVVQFHYNNGMVQDIVFESTDDTWSTNIKRGILNLLQVNLQQRGRLDAVEDMRMTNSIRGQESSNNFYRVMEETLEGKCETLYTIHQQPEYSSPVLNVTKSINFEKCEKRPQIQYNFRFADYCPTCESKYKDDEKFVKSSTVAKYNVTGTKQSFIIDSARVESEYIFTPLNEENNVIVTYVNQTLVLYKSSPIESSIQEPRQPVPSDSNIIFSLNWDIAYEKFHMTGEHSYHDELHKSQQGANKVELIQTFLRKTVQQMKERMDEDVPRNFVRMVTLMRMCKQSELEELINMRISPEEKKRVDILIPQALGVCGTKVCVKILSEKIQQREVPTLRAVMAIKSLLQNRVVSKEIIEEIIRLAESDTARQSPQLKRQCWLVAGSMINALCSSNEDKMAFETKENAEEYCYRELKEKYVTILFSKLHQEEKWEDKILMLKTIANAGLDISVYKLEKIIRQLDQSYPTYLRFEAISALRQLKDVMQKKIQRLLMPVAMDRREYPTIRAAASYVLLQTLPERPILDQLARSLNSEPSRQFASFLYTQMENYANSTNPCEQRMATDLKLSLRNAKKISTGLGYSMLKRASIHNKDKYMGADIDYDVVFSNTSAMPRHVSTSLHLNVLGFWKKHLASISLVNDGLLESLSQFYFSDSSLFDREQMGSFARRHPRQTGSEFERELDDLFSKHLRVNSRDYSSQYDGQPKAYLSTMYKSQSVSLLPLSKQSIMEMIQEGSLDIVDLKQKLARGIPIDYGTITLLHDMAYKVPTAFGIPIFVQMKAPLAWNLEGTIQGENGHKDYKLKAQLKPKFIATFTTDIKAWSPVVNSGIKLVSKARVFTPIDATVKVDLSAEPKTVKLTIKPPTETRDLLVLESRPVTYTVEWQKFIRNEEQHREELTIAGEELNRVSTYQKCYTSRVFGLDYCIRSHLQNPAAKTIKGTPSAPMAGLNKIVISTKPGPEISQEIEIELLGSLKKLAQNERPTFTDFQSFENWESTDSNEFSRSQESSETSNELLQQYRSYESNKAKKMEAALKIRTGSVERLEAKMSAQIDGKQRHSKVNLEMTYVPEQSKICFENEIMYPEEPALLEDMKEKKVVASSKLTWGQSCNSENYIKMNAKVERSNQQINWEREQREYESFQSSKCENKAWCSPLTQEDFLEEAAQLNKYRVEINYRNVPHQVQNITNKLYRALKYYYFWQTDVDQINVQNAANKIRAEVVLDAVTKQRVNVTVQTPKETVRMQDLPLSKPVQVALNQKKSLSEQFVDIVNSDDEQAECTLTGRSGFSRRSQVETFDGSKFSAPFESDCWVVLAKDCSSSKPKFAVLARKSQQHPEAKEVKIVTRNSRIELRPETQEYESVKVFVNGQPINPETEETKIAAQIEKRAKTVHVNLYNEGVKVRFDGYAVQIKLSEVHRAKQCGLCGHFDLETSDEFRNPDFTTEQDLRQFYLNYVVSDESCSRPSQLEEVCQDESCGRAFRSEETSAQRDDSDSSEELDNDQDATTERPQMKHKVIEMDNQICISKQAIPQCDDDSYPINVQRQEKVSYVCLDENEYEAELFERQARYGNQDIPALKSQTTSFTRNENFPEKCREYTRN